MPKRSDPSDQAEAEKQAKLKEAQVIQDRLDVLGESLEKLAKTVFEVTSKLVNSLEEDLISLKKYAATTSNEVDLDMKIAAINKRIENMAKTVIKERTEDAKRFKQILTEYVTLVDKLFPLIDAFEVSEAKKNSAKEHFNENRDKAQKEIEECTKFIKTLIDMIKNVQIEDKNVITKKDIDSKIDEVVGWLQRTRQFLFPN